MAALSTFQSSHNLVDCFGKQYSVIKVPGNGLCLFHSLSFCLSGDSSLFGRVIYDCINVFQNIPEIFRLRTGFGSRSDSALTLDNYVEFMQRAVQQVQTGFGVVHHDAWGEDGHICAVALLYNISIFTYSLQNRQWHVFNESATGGYVCLLNSTDHFDVLLGIDNNAPEIPSAAHTHAVNRQDYNVSVDAWESLQQHYSFRFVHNFPEDYQGVAIANMPVVAMIDSSTQDDEYITVEASADVFTCKFCLSTFTQPMSLKMHSLRVHKQDIGYAKRCHKKHNANNPGVAFRRNSNRINDRADCAGNVQEVNTNKERTNIASTFGRYEPVCRQHDVETSSATSFDNSPSRRSERIPSKRGLTGADTNLQCTAQRVEIANMPVVTMSDDSKQDEYITAEASENAFTCKVCLSTFTQPMSLKMHNLRVHKKDIGCAKRRDKRDNASNPGVAFSGSYNRSNNSTVTGEINIDCARNIPEVNTDIERTNIASTSGRREPVYRQYDVETSSVTSCDSIPSRRSERIANKRILCGVDTNLECTAAKRCRSSTRTDGTSVNVFGKDGINSPTFTREIDIDYSVNGKELNTDIRTNIASTCARYRPVYRQNNAESSLVTSCGSMSSRRSERIGVHDYFPEHYRGTEIANEPLVGIAENSTHVDECIKVETSRNVYNCDMCSCTFTQPVALEMHKLKVHIVRKCHVCLRIFKHLRSLQLHERRTHKKQIHFKEYGTQSVNIVQTDTMDVDIQDKKKGTFVPAKRVRFVCNIADCRSEFDTAQGLAIHKGRRHRTSTDIMTVISDNQSINTAASTVSTVRRSARIQNTQTTCTVENTTDSQSERLNMQSQHNRSDQGNERTRNENVSVSSFKSTYTRKGHSKKIIF